jgi:acetyl-CoA carboxylase biotin carboxyl carrier protein
MADDENPDRGASVDQAAILAAVDRLAPVLAESPLEELEVEAGGLTVRLAKPRVAVSAPSVQPVGAPTPAAATTPSSPFGEPAPGMRFVVAPLTGVWYAAPSPGARPYIAVGDEIHSGQVVGLIEAMKLFNEIKSDQSGKVARIMIDAGTLVKRQQPLLEIDPS